MEQRLKSLEDLCELITKEIVQQNKNIIEVNKNLITEIRSLREVYVKQDDDFEEFKNLLRKIYDLNKQNFNQMPPIFPPNNIPHPGQLPPPPHPQQQQQQPPIPNLNNSYMADQVNQSMLNNLSFQSERTPLNQHSLNPNTSAYSVPSSASAMQSQQFLSYFNQNIPQTQQFQPPPVSLPQQQQQQKSKNTLFPGPPPSASVSKPSPSQPMIPAFNPTQPPPSIPIIQHTNTSAAPKQTPFSFSNMLNNNKQPEQTTRFPSSQTTSTPQQSNQFSFSKLQSTVPAAAAVIPAAEKPKFQFSPSKPAVTNTKPIETVIAPAPTSLFGSNLFKITPEKSLPLFGGGTTNNNTAPALMKAPEPTSFSNLLKNVANDDEENEGGSGGGANPEDFEPQLDFQPIVKLQEVEVKTGEEDEEILFKNRCKLYRFDSELKEWKEKGVGEIKLLKHRQTQVIRVLMRRDQVLKLCANHRLSPTMTIKEMAPKQLSWLATDFSENVASTEMLLAKFKTIDDSNQFKKEFEKAVEASKSLPSASPASVKTLPPSSISNKPSLSETLKTDKWNCTGCYAPNKKEDTKCMCCGTLKPGATQVTTAPTTSTSKPSGSGLFSFGQPATKSNESPIKAPFSFGSTNSPSTTTNTTTKSFSFGLQQNTTTTTTTGPLSFGSTPFNVDSSKTQSNTKPATNLFGSPAAPATNLFSFAKPASEQQNLFQNSSLPSFASLASTTSTTSKPLFGQPENKGFGGGIQPSSQPPKPLFGANTIRSAATDENEDGVVGDQNPEEYEPQVEFKPLVKLQEVEVKTGEEDETAVFKQRCKLFRFDSDLKEWKEKGTGEMKILKHKVNEGMYRILMRRDQVLKLCANHRITSDLKFEIYNEKQVRWHAQDYSDGEGRHETLAARFKNEEEAKNFIKEAENALKSIESMGPTQPKTSQPKPAVAATSTKPTLSDVFKNDKQWKCNACYAPNSNDLIKCACCSTLKPGATEPATSTEKTATVGLSKLSFGSSPALSEQKTQSSTILFGSQSNSPAKFEFGKIFQNTNQNDSLNKTTLFGTLPTSKTAPQIATFSTTTIQTNQPTVQPDAATIFGNKSDLSFSDLAKKSQPSGFGGGFISTNPSPGVGLFSNFGKQPAAVFGSQTPNNNNNDEDGGGGDNDNTNPEEYEPQVDFKPLVKLNEVEVKTGEEDEEILFKQRCKLYRFNTETKEWKEKGVGEIKILKHKVKENCFRVLMRRDQVLKLCANHRIDANIKLETVNEKQLRWFVNDCSEDQPHAELLLAKFRSEDDVVKFRNEFENAQQILATNPSQSKSSTNQPSQSQFKVNNLASSLKTAPGTWSCSGCLSQNKAESEKCAACETPKPGSEDKNNDVIVVKEVTATLEQIEKARKFNLPDNFYLYENKTECAGCRGCRNEE